MDDADAPNRVIHARTMASLPARATDVAELVPASTGHVVAAAGDQIDYLLALPTALPALLVGQLEGLLLRLAGLEWTRPGVESGSAVGTRVRMAKRARCSAGKDRRAAEEVRARWLSAIQTFACGSVEFRRFLLEAGRQVSREQLFDLLPGQCVAAARRV